MLLSVFLLRFCPSVFFYLCNIVPAIWFLELYELDQRLQKFADINHDFMEQTPDHLQSHVNTTALVELENSTTDTNIRRIKSYSYSELKNLSASPFLVARIGAVGVSCLTRTIRQYGPKQKSIVLYT